jgi:hypothetical protein
MPFLKYLCFTIVLMNLLVTPLPSFAAEGGRATSQRETAEKFLKITKGAVSFNALNEKDEPVSITLDKNTVVIASSSWCHYCTLLYEALKKQPEIAARKTIVFVHGNEWEDFARPRLTESLEIPVAFKLLSEEERVAQVNTWVEKAKTTVHPYYLYPHKVPVLAGVRHFFIPNDCDTCSPANWNAFPSAYNPKTRKFDKDPYKVLELAPL